ncbi:hypothetical protein Taro_027320 [Colocasia esculenta]|uniref:Uncharacterized protein n=1 Tax=Colocasia esculenta TaxID=4460 RepID=A0A843V8E4_COLES|nr:hypothetical protein [Colocasia esculenta]
MMNETQLGPFYRLVTLLLINIIVLATVTNLKSSAHLRLPRLPPTISHRRERKRRREGAGMGKERGRKGRIGYTISSIFIGDVLPDDQSVPM